MAIITMRGRYERAYSWYRRNAGKRSLGYGFVMTDGKKKNGEGLTLMFLIIEDTLLHDIGDCIKATDA